MALSLPCNENEGNLVDVEDEKPTSEQFDLTLTRPQVLAICSSQGGGAEDTKWSVREREFFEGRL